MNRKRKSSGRMASKGYPNPIDVHVGNRIRLRRTLLGISQTTFAEGLGLTFQQVRAPFKTALAQFVELDLLQTNSQTTTLLKRRVCATFKIYRHLLRVSSYV